MSLLVTQRPASGRKPRAKKAKPKDPPTHFENAFGFRLTPDPHPTRLGRSLWLDDFQAGSPRVAALLAYQDTWIDVAEEEGFGPEDDDFELPFEVDGA